MKGIIFLIVLLVIIFTILFSFGFLTNYSTSFTKDFSFKKFSDINQGMKRQDVYTLIGQPFTFATEKTICEFYSREGKSFGLGAWIGWRKVGVCYDPIGKVTQTTDEIFFR